MELILTVTEVKTCNYGLLALKTIVAVILGVYSLHNTEVKIYNYRPLALNNNQSITIVPWIVQPMNSSQYS